MPKPSDQFTARDEANVLTALAFRNGYLEELHAGKHHPALDDPSVSRITDDEMKKLMIGASENLAKMLELKETDIKKYYDMIEWGMQYCRGWER